MSSDLWASVVPDAPSTKRTASRSESEIPDGAKEASMWGMTPDTPEVQRKASIDTALRRSEAALMSQFQDCMQAQSHVGFDSRMAAHEAKIKSVIAAATLQDPGAFPNVRQALGERWLASFDQTQQRRMAAQARSKTAASAEEAAALVARFPDSVRDRVATLAQFVIYGPGYNRGIAENLSDAARFAGFGPSAADDMEYNIRKAEAKAVAAAGGEFTPAMHPSESGRQQTLDGGEVQYGYNSNVYNAKRAEHVKALSARAAKKAKDGVYTEVWGRRDKRAALTLVASAGTIHWAVTNEDGTEEEESGSGDKVRDVLEDAWDALNKVLDHEPPPPEGVAQQVEQAADAAGEAVEQAGGSAPDDGDPTSGTEGDAPPADGDDDPPVPVEDSEQTTPSGAPVDDAADADPTPAADEADPDSDGDAGDAPAKTDGDQENEPPFPPKDGDETDPTSDAPTDDSADAGTEKGTAPDPASATDDAPEDGGLDGDPTTPDDATPVPPSEADTSVEGTPEEVVDGAEMGGSVEGVDPKSMETGQQISMTYTLGDGKTGTVDVTFVREDNGVFFFDGPKGEFGIGDRDGQWVDSEGNEFAFSDGDAIEEITGEEMPAGAELDEIDLDAPIEEAGAEAAAEVVDEALGAPDDDVPPADDDDSKDDEDEDDDDDFKKKFGSILATMRRENPGVSEARLAPLARRAAKLSKAIGTV